VGNVNGFTDTKKNLDVFPQLGVSQLLRLGDFKKRHLVKEVLKAEGGKAVFGAH